MTTNPKHLEQHELNICNIRATGFSFCGRGNSFHSQGLNMARHNVSEVHVSFRQGILSPGLASIAAASEFGHSIQS